MRQYCRYCAYLCTGNGTWCDEKEKELSESYTKSANNCKKYEDCKIDAWTGEERKERVMHEPRKEQCDGQLNLF